MNEFSRSIVKKLGYSFFANIISLLVSVGTVAILPKYMTVQDYGMYQLFLFYFGYVGFLHFGVLGGGIVRYAGSSYHDLDYSSLKSQCMILMGLLLLQLLIFYIINVILSIFTDFIIVCLFVLSTVAQHIIWYSISMLQMSNRIEDASKILLVERVIWGFLSISLVLIGYDNAMHIIYIFTATRILVMIYSCQFIPEIVWAPICLTNAIWKEFNLNFKIGFPITLSDICSILVIGVIRFSISDVWDITIFAKTSLILSITFFFLTFISSASTVLLPALKQLRGSIADYIYIPLNCLTSSFFLIALIGFYPMKLLISFWIPQYADSLIYMGILFPILYFESKFNLLVTTYLKKILKTQIIFYINLVATFISLIGCFLCCYYFRNLFLSLFLITFVLGIRYTLGEFLLSGFLNSFNKILPGYIASLILIVLFEVSVFLPDTLYGFALYSFCIVGYICISLKYLHNSWMKIKLLVVD